MIRHLFNYLAGISAMIVSGLLSFMRLVIYSCMVKKIYSLKILITQIRIWKRKKRLIVLQLNGH